MTGAKEVLPQAAYPCGEVRRIVDDGIDGPGLDPMIDAWDAKF